MPSSEYPYDPTEVFSGAELAEAARLRKFVTPHPSLRRRDHCPHATPCPNGRVCVEEIAWYLRHQQRIEMEQAS